jgi:hypothetical protein
VVANVLIPVLANISQALFPIALFFAGAVEFLVTMVGIAVLTSLYGFFVEGREF